MKKIAQLILTILGWRIDGSFPNLDNYVAVVAPHRTWKDFIVGLLVKEVSLLPPLKFAFKYEYTKVPMFHQFLVSLGGIPVDRKHDRGGAPKGSVTKVLLEVVSSGKPGMVALAPEGTRKVGVEWQKGFYQIAFAAKVPVIMVGLDYGRKKVFISKPVYLTGVKEIDLEKIKGWYQSAVPGYIPILNEEKF